MIVKKYSRTALQRCRRTNTRGYRFDDGNLGDDVCGRFGAAALLVGWFRTAWHLRRLSWRFEGRRPNYQNFDCRTSSILGNSSFQLGPPAYKRIIRPSSVSHGMACLCFEPSANRKSRECSRLKQARQGVN